MHVAPSSLFDISRQLDIQMARPDRLRRNRSVIQAREDRPPVSRRSFNSDPEVARTLGDVGRMHHALTAALESNEFIDEQYLLDFIY